jgi:hypothetical protein
VTLDCFVALLLAMTVGTDQALGGVMPAQVSSTEGYADEAEELFRRYEGLPAADVHRMGCI